MTYVERLEALRDEYLTRLEAKQAIQGLSWPQTETYLRESMLEIDAALRLARTDLASEIDIEAVSQAIT